MFAKIKIFFETILNSCVFRLKFLRKSDENFFRILIKILQDSNSLPPLRKKFLRRYIHKFTDRVPEFSIFVFHSSRHFTGSSPWRVP